MFQKPFFFFSEHILGMFKKIILKDIICIPESLLWKSDSGKPIVECILYDSKIPFWKLHSRNSIPEFHFESIIPIFLKSLFRNIYSGTISNNKMVILKIWRVHREIAGVQKVKPICIIA